jgi:hypothetical protein
VYHSQGQNVLEKIVNYCSLFAEGHLCTKGQNEQSDCTVVPVLQVFVVVQTLRVTVEEKTHTAAHEAHVYLVECSSGYVRPGFGSQTTECLHSLRNSGMEIGIDVKNSHHQLVEIVDREAVREVHTSSVSRERVDRVVDARHAIESVAGTFVPAHTAPVVVVWERERLHRGASIGCPSRIDSAEAAPGESGVTQRLSGEGLLAQCDQAWICTLRSCGGG